MVYTKVITQKINKIVNSLAIDNREVSLAINSNAYTEKEIAELEERNRLLGFDTQLELIDDYEETVSLLIVSNASSIDISVLAQSEIELPKDCTDLFQGLDVNYIDVSQLDTSNVTNMNGMFRLCGNICELDLSTFDTSKVVSIQEMFAMCFKLKAVDLSSFDTSSIMNMEGLFAYDDSLSTVDLTNFNTSNVKTMRSMFSGCATVKKLDLSTFDTRKVTSMTYMFNGCNSLTDLDISTFSTESITLASGLEGMFWGCSRLKEINAIDNKLLATWQHK